MAGSGADAEHFPFSDTGSILWPDGGDAFVFFPTPYSDSLGLGLCGDFGLGREGECGLHSGGVCVFCVGLCAASMGLWFGGVGESSRRDKGSSTGSWLFFGPKPGAGLWGFIREEQ